MVQADCTPLYIRGPTASLKYIERQRGKKKKKKKEESEEKMLR